MTDEPAGRNVPSEATPSPTVEASEEEQRSQKVIMDALKHYLERKEPPTLHYQGLETN